MEKEFLKELKETRKDYKSMIEFCCDNLILNNQIINGAGDFDLYAGDYVEYYDTNGNEISANEALNMNYSDYEEICKEFYQYFIISESDAERLATYTNEVIFYSESLDIYLLGVTHYGTPWQGVAANWKE